MQNWQITFQCMNYKNRRSLLVCILEQLVRLCGAELTLQVNIARVVPYPGLDLRAGARLTPTPARCLFITGCCLRSGQQSACSHDEVGFIV